MFNKILSQYLYDLGACYSARSWIDDAPLTWKARDFWMKCEDGSWMLWLLEKLIPHDRVRVLICTEMFRRSEPSYPVPKGRSKKALRQRRWRAVSMNLLCAIEEVTLATSPAQQQTAQRRFDAAEKELLAAIEEPYEYHDQEENNAHEFMMRFRSLIYVARGENDVSNVVGSLAGLPTMKGEWKKELRLRRAAHLVRFYFPFDYIWGLIEPKLLAGLK